METISRKYFIKRICCAGACLCGFGAIGLSNNIETSNPTNESNNKLNREWLAILLSNISEQIEENEKRNILKGCAYAHYASLVMDTVLAHYKHDLDKFISFLESEWGWKIEYNKKDNTIIADENKQVCVCPIAESIQNSNLSSLCYCSEGFAELMFSYIVQRPVSATVISSIHRGNKSCKYKIEL